MWEHLCRWIGTNKNPAILTSHGNLFETTSIYKPLPRWWFQPISKIFVKFDHFPKSSGWKSKKSSKPSPSYPYRINVWYISYIYHKSPTTELSSRLGKLQVNHQHLANQGHRHCFEIAWREKFDIFSPPQIFKSFVRSNGSSTFG